MSESFLEKLSKAVNPPRPDKSIFEVGKIYRYIGTQTGLPVFRTKDAAGSYPHTSKYEELGDLHSNEQFLVVAVEPFVLNDFDDEGNPFWDDEFIKIMSINHIGWICVDMKYQTNRHFEELTEESIAKEIRILEGKREKSLGGLGQFDPTFLVKRKTP